MLRGGITRRGGQWRRWEASFSGDVNKETMRKELEAGKMKVRKVRDRGRFAPGK